MKEKVRVTVTGIHNRPGLKQEETRSRAEGSYRFEKGTHIVEYEEYMDDCTGGASVSIPASHDEHGGEECRNVTEGEDWHGGVATYNLLRITKSSMEVIRKGSVESELHFEQGREHLSEYKTAFGVMQSRIVTKRYALYAMEQGARLIAEAEYTVSMNGMSMSETLMRVDIQSI